MTDRLGELIELGDSNAMLREIDARSDAEDWDGLLELSSRCRIAAEERGKPLWGASAYANYRVALDGPGSYLELVIDADLGRFGLGPLSEVAASSHDWDEITLPSPLTPAWEAFVYECVARGDDPQVEDDVARMLVDHREMPLALADWEPDYELAEYHPDRVDAPRPLLQVVDARSLEDTGGELVDDAEAVDALVDLVRIWQDQSNGDVSVSAASGPVDFAIHDCDPDAQVVNQISPQSAASLMAWAGASGGAHGRRAGMSVGRSKAWMAIAAVAGQEEWPLHPDEVGTLSRELQWYTWDTARTGDGWSFALAVVDEVDDAAFAIFATDTRDEDPV